MVIPRLFRRSEQRSFTDDVIGQALRLASTNTPDGSEIAAAQYVRNLIGGAMATAEVQAPANIRSAITPDFLDTVAAGMVLDGECFYDIDTASGVELLPAVLTDVAGGARASSWVYDLELRGPSTQVSIRRPADAILHFRWATRPERPWRGTGPLQSANLTVETAVQTEAKLGAEVGKTRVKHVLPVPFADANLTELRKDLADGDGGLLTPPTFASGAGAGRANAPPSDYGVKRIGANPPTSMTTLRSESAMAVLAAYGISPGLLQTQGGAIRESYRQCWHSVIKPCARKIAFELSRKLETEITINPTETGFIDLQAKSRAFAQFINAKIPPDRALELAGLA